MKLPDRFHLLDALRGIAALSVVCFHWQNFLITGDAERAGYAGTDQPFYDFLRLFYERGFLAVDLFFSLSGFIFFCYYNTKIADGKVRGLQFFVLRFSRLYPLHLLTLLLVAVGQMLFFAAHGRYMAYWHNDLYHFALNVSLLSSVGLEHGLGFNGPAWSISVEAVLYLLFFIACRFQLTRFWGSLTVLAIAAFGFFVLSGVYAPMGRGIGSFFLGGAVFAVYRWLAAQPYLAPIAGAAIGLAALFWLLTWCSFYRPWVLGNLHLPAALSYRFPTLVLFPLTILALALAETWRAGLGRRVSWLGDISYSSYLWHFPLQLVFALALTGWGLSFNVFKSSSIFLLFMVLLLLLSWASHRFLEMPAQQALRRRWLTRQPVA